MSAPRLYTKDGSYPAALPFRIRLSDGMTRTDPESFTADEIADAGYTEAPAKPSFDAETQRLGWDGSAWTVEDLPPPPPPQPRALGRMEFLDLLQGEGGMTDQQFLDSKDDANLRILWEKVGIATQVERDHSATTEGLAALEQLDYLPNGSQAVLDAWPTK